MKAYQRQGLPLMTTIMLAVLQRLRDANQDGRKFIHLDDVHGRTLNSLERRDWIFSSPGLDGTRYCITGRGLKALDVYEAPSKRHTDGLCPRCRKNPLHQYSSGKTAGYCYQCLKKRSKTYKGRRVNPNRLCSRCHKRPVHISSSGRARTYCTSCEKESRKEERARRIARRFEAIAQGNPPLCVLPHCNEPIYYTTNTAYDYCYKHYREEQNRAAARRAFRNLSLAGD